jgi:hypothetical protein
MSNSATAAPPAAVNRAAPASGAISRRPSRACLHDAVCLGQLVGGQHRREQRRPAGAEHGERDTVGRGDRVQDPDVPAVVHEQQRQDRGGGREVRDDQQRPPPHAVDEHPEQRRDQLRRGEEEEDHAGGGARAGQLLGPDAEREPERRVTEDRQRVAGHVQPHVAAGEDAPHRQSTT